MNTNVIKRRILSYTLGSMGRPFPQVVQTYAYEYTDNRAATDHCDGGNLDQRRVAFNELLGVF
jgi:hypothetical protein